MIGNSDAHYYLSLRGVMRKSDTLLPMSRRSHEQESVFGIRMTEQERAAWGAKIRPARHEMGLTQQEVAEMSGVSLKTIGNIESGRIVPQAASLRRLMMALDLGPDPADSFSDDVHTWLAILGPLIANLPADTRGEVMLGVVKSLGEEIAGRSPRLTADTNVDDSKKPESQRLALVRRDEGGKPQSLPTENQGLNPDGMPPFDPSKLLAARQVPDELSSLRPQLQNPEDVPDPAGPEDGA